MKLLLTIGFMLCIAVTTVTSRHCNNLLPGLNRLFRGIDVTKLDLLPLEFTGSHGFKQPVLDASCNQQKKWTLDGVEYDQPDQVTLISSFPGGWSSSQVHIFKSYHEVKRTMSSSAGMDYGFGIFSASASYKNMQHSIANNSDYIERVSAFSSGRRADLAPFWALELGQIPQMFTDNFLSQDFETSPKAYNQFIQYYGTHFFKNARYGGVISLMITTDSSYFFGREDRVVEAQARASFLNLLKAEGGYSGSVTTIDSTFEKLSKKYVRYYGGNTNLLSSSGISAWQPTVATNPWLFSGDLVPITELFRNQTKKQSMQRAITNYLNLAELEEYERLLVSHIKKMPNLITLQELLEHIHNVSSQEIPSQTDVRNIRTTMTRLSEVPDWFKNNVVLCYNNGLYGIDIQFNFGENLRALGSCSPLGEKTNWRRATNPAEHLRVRRFLKGTVSKLLADYRAKSGQWSLNIKLNGNVAADPWFSNTEICMKTKCDGSSEAETCSKVNTAGVVYTHSNSCSYSWKLKTPSNAPAWTNTVQLCYHKRDSDNSASQALCAPTNQWTPSYDGTSPYISWELNLDLMHNS